MWDGNPIKLDCDDHCTTTNVINSLSNEKKMWYIYTMEYHSAITGKEIMAFAATGMDLEMIMLSEVSQTVRHQHQMLSLTRGI